MHCILCALVRESGDYPPTLFCRIWPKAVVRRRSLRTTRLHTSISPLFSAITCLQTIISLLDTHFLLYIVSWRRNLPTTPSLPSFNSTQSSRFIYHGHITASILSDCHSIEPISNQDGLCTRYSLPLWPIGQSSRSTQRSRLCAPPQPSCQEP